MENMIKSEVSETLQASYRACPIFRVFIAERELDVVASYESVFEEIAESKSYYWKGSFEPEEWIYNSNSGSCPILILCAADLANACRSLWKIGYRCAWEDCRFEFEPTDDIVHEFAAQGKIVKELTEQERQSFIDWFKAAYGSEEATILR